MVDKHLFYKKNSSCYQTIINEGERERWDISDPLYFGGVPDDVKDSAYKKWHIRHTESFGGKGAVRGGVIIHGRGISGHYLSVQL